MAQADYFCPNVSPPEEPQLNLNDGTRIALCKANMGANMEFKKIIWAVDVTDPLDRHTNVLQVLRALGQGQSIEICPVFVLSAPYAQALSSPVVDLESDLQALAEKKFSELAEKSGLSNVAPGKVLVNYWGSLRRDVQQLIEYAVDQKADAIVVATHARQGISRFLMGSFAETLAVNTSVPIISVNPDTKTNSEIKNILFPTLFLAKHRLSFERVIKWAKSLDASVTLFYQEPLVHRMNFTEEVSHYIEEETKERFMAAKRWKTWAAQQEVNTEIHFARNLGHFIPSIIDFAKHKHFDLIAMPSEATPLSAALLGSSAREIIRHAPCPVWVLRMNS
jgi:nucleotide-binding universal stress UspA family protein